MDTQLVIVGSVAAGLFVLLVATYVVARVRGRRLRRTRVEANRGLIAAEAETMAVRRELGVAQAGEREAAWAAGTSARLAAQRLERLLTAEEGLRQATRALHQAEARVDEIQVQLAASESEVDEWRRRTDESETRTTVLEGDLATVRQALSTAEAQLDDLQATPSEPPTAPDTEIATRLHDALTEAHRLRDRVSALETTLATRDTPTRPEAPIPGEMLPPDPWEAQQHRRTLAERDEVIARLEAELASARDDAAGAGLRIAELEDQVAALSASKDRDAEPITIPSRDEDLDRLRARLAAREAELAELQQRLDAVGAARSSEVRRLNDRIAGMEHLYAQVEGKDQRIAELESALKEVTEQLDDSRAAAEQLDGEVRSLRASLDDDRNRVGVAQAAAESSRTVEDLEQRLAAHSMTIEDLRSALTAERERNIRLSSRPAAEGNADLTTAIRTAIEPLQERIRSLEGSLQRPVAAAPTRPPGTGVTRIKGIGPVIAGILADNGITTIRQIAAFTDTDVERIGAQLPVFAGRIERDDWIGQAKAMLSEEAGA